MAPSMSTLSIALLGAATCSLALPSQTLYTADTQGKGTFLWVSGVQEKVFGLDATDFDYYLFSEPTGAKAAVDSYAAAVKGGNEGEIITAFLNATSGGTLTAAQAADSAWKCAELPTGAVTTLCDAAATGPAKRSTYYWMTSTSHVSSEGGMDGLASVLGDNPNYQFASSPRSYCNKDNTNKQACISWSKTQTWTHGQGQNYIKDAESAVNFNKYSAQSNNALNGNTDICLSNRADGCT